jgi:hypothetical protein
MKFYVLRLVVDSFLIKSYLLTSSLTCQIQKRICYNLT